MAPIDPATMLTAASSGVRASASAMVSRADAAPSTLRSFRSVAASVARRVRRASRWCSLALRAPSSRARDAYRRTIEPKRSSAGHTRSVSVAVGVSTADTMLSVSSSIHVQLDSGTSSPPGAGSPSGVGSRPGARARSSRPMKRAGRSAETQTTLEGYALSTDPAGYGTSGSASTSRAPGGGRPRPRATNSDSRSTHSSIRIVVSRSRFSPEAISERSTSARTAPDEGTARKPKAPADAGSPATGRTPKHIDPAGTRATNGRRLTGAPRTSSTAKRSRWPRSTRKARAGSSRRNGWWAPVLKVASRMRSSAARTLTIVSTRRDEHAVEPVFLDQPVVRSLLHDTAAVEHDDFVRVTDRA